MKRIIKGCLLVIAVFGFSCFLSAQNLNENLSEGNKKLLQELNKQEQERKNRVNAFFSKNPTFSRSLANDENKIIYIHDIWNGKPIYRSSDNREAGLATKTSHLQAGGSLGLNLDGSGMTVGVWDGGPAQASHPEFANSTNTGSRVTVMDVANVNGDSGFSSHGTHVTGTISAKGVNFNALGMAPNVNVKSYNWTNDTAEMLAAATDPLNPIIISNHSYGTPVSTDTGTIDAWIMGAYTQGASNIDNLSKNNPKYLIVTSAGNEGSTSYTGGMYAGYDKLTTDKNAKNTLVVANASPSLAPFTNELTSVFINSGSSQGPTDDLRIKPDIAADGTNLFSPIPTDAYASFTGTSMASPNTAGTLLLLQQYYFLLNGEYMNSSTLKALVCHTALDDVVTPGPDPIFGWGFLDAKLSAETITEDNIGDSIIDEQTLDEGETYTFSFSAQAGEKLKATICWTDMPGVVSNGTLNDPTPRLVNDLDLRLTKDGNTFFPWKLDYSPSSGFSNSKGDNIVDNIETIEIDVPSTGIYTLTVTHKGTLKSNEGGPFDDKSQDFGLIITGNSITLSTADYELSNAKLWPNPSNSILNLSYKTISNQDVSLSISDLQGRLVFNKSIKNPSSEINESIDVSSFSKGTYILSIKEGTNIFNHKIIVD